MADSQVIDWVKSEKEKGYSREQIYSALVGRGYTPQQANEAIDSAQGTSAPITPPPVSDYSSKEKMCTLSVLSIIFAFLFPIAGIVLGILAISKIKKDSSLKGRKLAIAGIVIGAIFTFIVPVLVMVGALAFFGVLNPNNMLPDRCSLGMGFMCDDFKISGKTNTIDITISTFGEELFMGEISITGDGLSECKLADEKGIIINANSPTALSIPCKSISQKKGESVRAEIDMTYWSASTGSSFSQQSQGNLITHVS